EARLTREAEGVRAEVRLVARNVGHRVPTGFIDRQLLLVVEGEDENGQFTVLKEGPRLPVAAGEELAGRPGRLFARLWRDEEGNAPVPFWRALPEPTDTRLVPERTEVSTFTFSSRTTQVRVRVLHRRFWAEVIRSKQWPDRDLVVLERVVGLRN